MQRPPRGAEAEPGEEQQRQAGACHPDRRAADVTENRARLVRIDRNDDPIVGVVRGSLEPPKSAAMAVERHGSSSGMAADEGDEAPVVRASKRGVDLLVSAAVDDDTSRVGVD